MFKNLKLKLTIQFVILSALVYLILTSIGVYLFHRGLTEGLDDQLQDIAAGVIHSIKQENGSLALLNSPKSIETGAYPMAATIQIYGPNRQLISSLGPKGIESLLPSASEAKVGQESIRTFSQTILNKDQIVGYLQIETSTAHRERAITEFLDALTIIGPLLILALAASGYFYAAYVIMPVEKTFDLLKRFIADAGHELKTPITIIQATCDNLSKDIPEDNEQAQERLGVIERSTDRMQGLVSDLLLLTKSEQASIAQKILPLRLDMLLRETIGEFSDLFEEKNIELKADEIRVVKILGDKEALHKMFSNLLENALKYTNTGGSVTISLTTGLNSAILKISDTGLGIPADCLDKIFERFYRVDESRTRSAGGSGLGLSIVKAIAEAHHASINVESELGKGSSFTVTFPLVGQSTFFRMTKDV